MFDEAALVLVTLAKIACHPDLKELKEARMLGINIYLFDDIKYILLCMYVCMGGGGLVWCLGDAGQDCVLPRPINELMEVRLSVCVGWWVGYNYIYVVYIYYTYCVCVEIKEKYYLMIKNTPLHDAILGQVLDGL